ncbi:MAG: carboxypeptidase-like regulatory domain-containing protein [Bacteroidia bacterium]|nr:carboxypeptidase-like regulatory domain-containing protein [Bacteroidia bacterium]MCF8426551.1 carboxypeptidase-like regulatory domain-containing protein [Bacteroidia bacterium]MCF8447330.1 carboxypeptidase-like regulatory domain-containing protein [Bacteroidia bacterium]
MTSSTFDKRTGFGAVFLLLLLSLLASIFNLVTAQNSTQNIRGLVQDKVSQAPLSGAVIRVINSNTGCSADADGKFLIQNISVGKVGLRITYLGYKELVLPNLTLNAGKELVLTITLEEEINKINEVVVKGAKEKNKPLNSMSTVSTRTFSVEETQKFAAAVNDPARMATSFAGVVQAGDGNNHISIRGNSPNGLLWRMEGVDIPNPNHFSNVGTSGGGISILSSQLLSNSDFSTGAFASEYGNALSGVFDLKLRKGNNQKREYTFQAGFLGLDAAVEGPLKKGYEGSYLINYRYSTLSVLGQLGVPLGDAVTNFQDLAYNFYLPAGKFGTFGAFGFGGLSYQDTKPLKDSLKWQEDAYYQYKSHFFANTGAAGFNHMFKFKNHSYLKTSLVFSGTQNGYEEEKLEEDYSSLKRTYAQDFNQKRITLTSVYTQKVNARNTIRTGFTMNRFGFNLNQAQLADSSQKWITQINNKGNTYSAQSYFQWNHAFSEKLSSNIGFHYQELLLNNSRSFEPRLALKYEANQKNQFTFGYGIHSQIQPMGVYFAKDQMDNLINQQIGLSKAQHFVLGFDHSINSHTHIKTELYYQHLFQIPISTDPTSTYSILNDVDGYPTEKLENKGLGKNYGLELTVERFLHNNFYYLLSGSFYQSQYLAPNKEWYNTRFNTNHALTLTLGKEWDWKGKSKNRVIGLNLKTLYVGGWRNTPIDLAASQQKGEMVEDFSKTYTLKNPDYFRSDIRISVKRNYNKVTTTLALDIQNVSNRKNVGGQYFDSNTGAIKYWYQAPLIPILSYRIEF